MQTLVASAARAASGNSGFLQQHFEVLEGGIFLLDVTAASALAGDTLNVYVQHAPDDGVGPIVDDFVSFTQVLGNGGAKRFLAYWLVYGGAPSTPMKTPQDAQLTAGQVQQGPISATWRVKWVIAGTGSFTFSLSVEQWQAG